MSPRATLARAGGQLSMNNGLAISLAAFVGWLLITAVGGRIQTGEVPLLPWRWSAGSSGVISAMKTLAAAMAQALAPSACGHGAPAAGFAAQPCP
jgi:hypothetical protein